MRVARDERSRLNECKRVREKGKRRAVAVDSFALLCSALLALSLACHRTDPIRIDAFFLFLFLFRQGRVMKEREREREKERDRI